MNDPSLYHWPVAEWDGDSPFTAADYGPVGPEADIAAGRIRLFDSLMRLLDHLDG